MPPVTKVEDQPVVVATTEFPYAKWKFEKFNPVQSRIMDFYEKETSGLIAAMTSAGKTVVAEMFLSHEIRKRGGKGMFLAPLRALAQEKIDDWTDKSYHFADKNISICTGDYRLTKERAKELSQSDLIIMSTEMLNHRSRNHKSEQNDWLKEVGTLVIDECVSPDALVETDHGFLPIGQIIDQNLDVKIASFNHSTRKVEFKKIVARQKKLLKRKWRTLYYQGGDISVTENHMVWCEGRGYIPSKDILVGDIVYVRRINASGEAGNSGNTVGGRVDSPPTTRQVGSTQNTTICQAKDFSRVEIQRIEKTGWHPAEDQPERWLRGRNMQFQHAIISSFIGDISDCVSERKENGNRSVAGSDQRSGCIGNVVYGRRQSESQSNGNSYRRIFKTRSGIAGNVAENEVVNRLHSVSDQTILATQIYGRWSGQISGDDSQRNYSGHGIQSVGENGASILFHVRDGIYGRPSGNSCSTQSFAVSEFRLSEKMGSNEGENETMDSTESWCCDLEIEGNNNFFVNGVLVHNSHLLTVPGRGDHLEVGLMKFTEINPTARLVLLSATMPNVEEIAEWISYALTKRDTFCLRSSYRPCPLNTHFETYYDGYKKYDDVEAEKVAKALDIIEYYPNDKFLVFAHTKRTGELMKQSLRAAGIPAEFHNANLDKKDRIALEHKFRTDPKLRVIVATPTLAWGLNMPARRVIILGVHRGLDEVETYNVTQMIGRSGRVGLDPQGDAYILLPESKMDQHKTRLKVPQRIESQLLSKIGDHHKVLAFHLVSEIHHGDIKTTDDVHSWYKRSLASFQNKALNDSVIDKTLELLRVCGAIRLENDEWEATTVGMVSSMFYFSPFDVADLKKNFTELFAGKHENNDYWLSMAIGNVDGQRMNIVSKAEKDEMSMYATKVRELLGTRFYNDASMKAGFCYFQLLNGNNSGVLSGMQRNLQFDYNRLSQVLTALDSMGCKWNRAGWFRGIEQRIANGVPMYLVDLCRVANIGKTRAKRLYDNDIKTVGELALLDPEKAKKLLNMKADAVSAVLAEAVQLDLIG